MFLINILTIDVEDYYQVENFKKYISIDEWDTFESHVVNSTHLLLDILKKYNIKATFFVLGWTAEKYPQLVQDIYQQGHEIASHGYKHLLVYDLNKETFYKNLKKSINIIENIIDDKIFGFRAPSFSITRKSLWALDIMKDLNLKYDSSIYPISGHNRYGISDADPYIFKHKNQIIEVPPASFQLFNKRWPIGGGGYFRLLPYKVMRLLLKKIDRTENPFVMYFHPWEFDPNQPKIKEASYSEKFRHYININKNEKKFNELLSDFEFTTIKDYLISKNYI